MNREAWESEWEEFLLQDISIYEFYGQIPEETAQALPFWTLEELAETDWDEFIQLTGTVDYITWERLRYVKQKLVFVPKVAELAFAGKWEDFSHLVQATYETMPEAFNYFYEDMPAQYRREFVVGCYEHHGDGVWQCREALKELPTNGLEELPEEYAKLPEITVYRAGEETVDEAPARLSWTLDKEKARWFLREYIGRHAQRFFRAHVRPCDVIAYTDERDEKEVLQFESVYDVEIIEELEGGAE